MSSWASIVRTNVITNKSEPDTKIESITMHPFIETEKPKLIDFGANYSGRGDLSDIKVKKIIEDSMKEGVMKVVCISNQMTESINNVRLAELIPQLHFTLGIHPHNAKTFKLNNLSYIEQNITNPQCFGIGEIGLDFNRNFSTKEEQIFAFTEQLKLAKRLDAKVYLHCRDAHDVFMDIVTSVGHYKGIVHCFTGNVTQALEFTRLGFKLGITGWLLDKRRNSQLVEAIKDTRIDCNMLLVETDAPFMSVHKNRKHSLPPDVLYVAKEIARLKSIDEIACINQLYQNAVDFL